MRLSSLAAPGLATLFLLPFCANSFARDVAVGLRSAPPYVIASPTGVSGIEHDIIAAALAERGHKIVPKLYPFARLVLTFNQNEAIDAAAPVNASLPVKGTLSAPYVTYTNVGISLVSGRVKAQHMADLGMLSVVAFQNARVLLGPAFADVIAPNPNYREEANQQNQIRVLFNARADLIIGEQRILHYFIAHPEPDIDATPPVREHPLFAPIDYSVVFRDPTLAQDFNEGLAAIKASGAYDAILQKY